MFTVQDEAQGRHETRHPQSLPGASTEAAAGALRKKEEERWAPASCHKYPHIIL